jgi:proteasome accessory factor B
VSRARTERLLNLVICLLAARRYLSREEIRRAVPGYSATDEAFERAFERDKEQLREMGIPVETGSNSVWFEDEVGYRIRRDSYALPEVSFAADELAVLSLAARAWQQATLAGAASSALLKLQAYGVARADLDADLGPAGIEPRVDTNEAAFVPLWRALAERRPVRFPYRRPGDRASASRTVEPWGIVARHGRWYLVGRDRDRADTRVFRVSRITGPIEQAGRPGDFSVPEGVDVRREVADVAARTGPRLARIRVRAGAAGFLRRSAEDVAPDGQGWDRLTVAFSDPELFADAVTGLGPDAVVLEPDDVRESVRRRLRAVAGLPRDGTSAPDVRREVGAQRRAAGVPGQGGP